MSENARETFDLADPEFVSTVDELSLWSAPFGLALLDAIRIRRGIRALDIGCGLGFPLLEIAGRLGPGCEAHGIDPWAVALDRARVKLRRREMRNVELHQGVAEQLPFADGYFDLIVSNNGFNNVQDQSRAFAEAFRVSRPGAQLVLTMNLPDSMKEFYDVFAELLRETGRLREIEAMRKHIASKRQPRAATESRIREAGFQVVKVVEDEFRLRFADGTALFRHFFIRLAFLPSWKGVLPKRDDAKFFGELEERLNRLAAERGELSLTIPFARFDCMRP